MAALPVITSPQEFNTEDLYVDLRPLLGSPLRLKCEGFNFAGSVKLKAAATMVEAAEQSGLLTEESILVESSSGNLGVALSVIAADKGYRFVCVTDNRCNRATRRMMEALGAEVRLVTRPDLDVLFVGAGTTGTLMGCARYFRESGVPVTVVAVDTVGSVTFGGPALPRMIPGLGAGVRPELLDVSYVDDVVMVDEAETVRTCRRLASAGFLFGGSTGTVVAGAQRWLAAHHRGKELTAVAIAPDLGERYLDTLYQESWVRDVYGGAVLDDEEDTAHRRPLMAP